MNNVIHGDSLTEMLNVPSDAFIISDPPYNQKYHYSKYKDDLPDDEYVRMLLDVFGNRKSVVILYPEDTIRIFGGGKMGSQLMEVVSWVYPSNTAKQSRLITWWNCKPDFRKIPQPYKNPTDKRIAKRIADGKTCRSYDWWEINQVKNVSKADNPHPCPVPLELMEKIIKATTEEGDIICDPFAGSGTTLLAAKNLKRNYIGIEMDEEYVSIARKRLND